MRRLAILLLAITITAGCAVKSATLTDLAATSTPTPAASPEKPTKPAHYCGAKTKAGTACRKRVKNEGERCFMHQGQAAL